MAHSGRWHKNFIYHVFSHYGPKYFFFAKVYFTTTTRILFLIQGCPNHTFGGVFLHPDLRYFQLKYDLKFDTQVEEVKIGLRNFLVASKWGSKGITLHLDCERLGRSVKLKFRRKLHTINIGPRNFIHLHLSIGWATISNFPGKIWNFPLLVIRLLTMFHRFQENI